MNKTSSSLIPVITEAERILKAAVSHFSLKTDPANICVTVQSKGRKNALGWFAPDWWKHKKSAGTKAETSFHEINLSAEHLATCDIGELILHELAHAENQTLGIRDCANRVHNKHFKSMAERLGLEVKPRDKAVGFGYTDLAEPGKSFLAKVKFDKAVFDAFRSGQAKKGKVGSRLIKCECEACGYVVRTTQKWIDGTGAPLCPCNKKSMEVA
jgi:hypothetical protein